jgi:hypothetical protein
MARAAKPRSTTAPVALLAALQEVKQRFAVDDRTARGIILEAHRFGDLKFVINRPDGSAEEFGPRRAVLGDEAFDTGVIDVPYRMPRSHRRGLPWSEPCRVFVTRESLAHFLSGDEPSPSGKRSNESTVDIQASAPAQGAPDAQSEESPPDVPRTRMGILEAYFKDCLEHGKHPKQTEARNLLRGAGLTWANEGFRKEFNKLAKKKHGFTVGRGVR